MCEGRWRLGGGRGWEGGRFGGEDRDEKAVDEEGKKEVQATRLVRQGWSATAEGPMEGVKWCRP